MTLEYEIEANLSQALLVQQQNTSFLVPHILELLVHLHALCRKETFPNYLFLRYSYIYSDFLKLIR